MIVSTSDLVWATVVTVVCVGFLVLGMALGGCASTAPFTVQFCPGHPKALTESDKSRHVCHLGDALGLWRGKQRQKIREGFQR